MITPQQALARLVEQREIFHDEMLSLMRQIMNGELTPVQIAGILTGLRVKKETVGEIAAAAQVMREFAATVPARNSAHLVDTCGTGGDAAHTFNISTAAAFVAAAAGARVAKHGGRSVSSTSGSADVLEALGVSLDLTPGQVAASIDAIGIGFMFAPKFHGAMKHAAPARRELGVRTIFNILGPLTNPAGAPHQLLGVFHPDLVGILVRVLQRLGSRHVMVVHGSDGMDEITLSGETLIGELKDGEVMEYAIHPREFGFEPCGSEALKVWDATQAKDMLLGVLDGLPGPARDIVLLNAGAAIYVADRAATLGEGIELAREAIASGAARERLRQLVEFSNRAGEA
ncbi:MAG: anthranilate phosphoribosyltransferase [Thiobacillus sp. 65-1059]|nr:MAG: anthranilate phosphoribosyltransferase [Thiobacillus sp. 65-1059]